MVSLRRAALTGLLVVLAGCGASELERTDYVAGGPAGGGAGQAGVSGGSGYAGQGTGGGEPLCATNMVVMGGTLAGQPFSFADSLGFGAFFNVDPWSVSQASLASQLLAIGTGKAPASGLPALGSVVRWPIGGSSWYCAHGGELVGSFVATGSISGHFTLSMPALEKLGTCADATPVAGGLTACQSSVEGGNCPPGGLLSGTLEGSAIETSLTMVYGDAAPPMTGTEVVVGGKELPIVVQARAGSGGASGLLLVQAPATQDVRVYCIGEDTSFGETKGNVAVLTVPSVKRLGVCGAAAPSSGELTACF